MIPNCRDCYWNHGLEEANSDLKMTSLNKTNEVSISVSTTPTRSLDDIQSARENRTVENLKLKDEQIRIVTDQNKLLLESIDRAEEELGALQTENCRLDKENKILLEQNFEVKTLARAADGKLQKVESETVESKEKLQALALQNVELLKLLEEEETSSAKLLSESKMNLSEIQVLKENNAGLLDELKKNKKVANESISCGSLQVEEIRLLKTELDQLKHRNTETSMRTSVEMESLQEQLRARKEKQYQLLQKLQNEEESRRHADDQVQAMQNNMKILQSQSSDLEERMKLQLSNIQTVEGVADKLRTEVQDLTGRNKILSNKFEASEKCKLRLEAEGRETCEQLREMAEKVFQLLERLKLAERGKTRSTEALKNKETELGGLKKKHAFVVKEIAKEAKLRGNAELEKRENEEILRGLKKHNVQLGVRCKDEIKAKIRAEERHKEAEQKIQTLNGRLSFVVNRLHMDAEVKILQKEEAKKIEGQLKLSSERCKTWQHKLDTSERSNKILTEQLSAKEREGKDIQLKLEAFQQTMADRSSELSANDDAEEKRARSNKSKDRFLAGGRHRFFVESKPTIGLITIKAKNTRDREWIEAKGCNSVLRKAIKASNSQEVLIKRIVELYGISAVMEEEIASVEAKVKEGQDEIERRERKLHHMHKRLCVEEESKRHTLLRYINAVKASVSLGEPGCEKDRKEVGHIGAGRIKLPDANLMDEEAHAIASMLRNNQTIAELNLRGNSFTDDGARAFASLLSCPTALRYIDLRCNCITRMGIKAIVEALQRSDRVNHVHVHPGGRIEALGNNDFESNRKNLIRDQEREEVEENSSPPSITSVCIVDISDNGPQGESHNTSSGECGRSKSKNAQDANTPGRVPLHCKEASRQLSPHARHAVSKGKRRENKAGARAIRPISERSKPQISPFLQPV